MSGGSLDYVFRRVDDAADMVEDRATEPIHKAFAAHLRLVSKALHDLEWVWSCDYGRGDEVEAIRAVIHHDAELKAAIADAEIATEHLSASIAHARAMMAAKVEEVPR
jgi:hypothetical protein